jgi:16S rRNA G966 N2-methylase RsmD
LNPEILNNTVQRYINDHLDEDITRLLLKKSPFPSITSRELAEQIESKKRCEKKLPLWYNTAKIYYPPKLAIEQASSEQTATYKSDLVNGDTLIDLTGGLGVDSYYFSAKVERLIHCEQNKELSVIAAYNLNLLGADNIKFINQDCIAYLKNSDESFNIIFADPSRRVKTKKVFLLKDCEPDVISNFELLQSKAKQIMIKTSPLLDIQSGLSELKHVKEIHIISVKNDCKELLWVIDRDFDGEPEVNCAAINGSQTQTFSFKLSEERSLILKTWSVPLDYIYEPDVSLLKSGCFKLITERFSVKKLHPNTHLYTSSDLKENFTGRKFKVISCTTYAGFGKGTSLSKANVIARNFPLSPEEIKKKHHIRDGSSDYLLFTTGPSNQLLVIHAGRV